jgi:hypothetical protein
MVQWKLNHNNLKLRGCFFILLRIHHHPRDLVKIKANLAHNTNSLTWWTKGVFSKVVLGLQNFGNDL